MLKKASLHYIEINVVHIYKVVLVNPKLKPNDAYAGIANYSFIKNDEI